jgi:hypothetical protein
MSPLAENDLGKRVYLPSRVREHNKVAILYVQVS